MRLAPALAAVLTLGSAAACGGASSPSSAASHPPSPSLSGASTGASPEVTGASAGPHTSASVRSTAASSAPGATASATAAGASPTAAASSSSRATPLTPAGTYTYTIKGHADSALGSQSLDGTSTLTVDPANGDSQHSTQQDKGGTTEQTVIAHPSGLFLGDLHMSQQGFDEEFRPSPPVLLFPIGAKPGRSWHWKTTSTDGKYTLDASLKVGRPRTVVSASGQRIATVTVSSVLVITGDAISLTIHQLDRASDDGLIVVEHAVADGTAYGTKFHSDSTRTLRSKAR